MNSHSLSATPADFADADAPDPSSPRALATLLEETAEFFRGAIVDPLAASLRGRCRDAGLERLDRHLLRDLGLDR